MRCVGNVQKESFTKSNGLPRSLSFVAIAMATSSTSSGKLIYIELGIWLSFPPVFFYQIKSMLAVSFFFLFCGILIGLVVFTEITPPISFIFTRLVCLFVDQKNK